MADRPKMPIPREELSPQQLANRIRKWAEEQGYSYQFTPAKKEFGTVRLDDSEGGFTTALIPNAHGGRRLRKDQVRYVVDKVNNNWRN